MAYEYDLFIMNREGLCPDYGQNLSPACNNLSTVSNQFYLVLVGNMCETERPACEFECTEVNYERICSCADGYALQSNGFNCQGIKKIYIS